MNDQNRDLCNFHPKQALIGVCPFCLNDKLLLLQARRNRHHHAGFSNIFAGGSDHHTQSTSTSTLEDSFISIKFEENGVAKWDKGNWRSVSNNSVMELPKGNDTSLRWRNRIGQFLLLVKLKRSIKCIGGAPHVDGVVKVTSKGCWIRALTKKKTSKK